MFENWTLPESLDLPADDPEKPMLPAVYKRKRFGRCDKVKEDTLDFDYALATGELDRLYSSNLNLQRLKIAALLAILFGGASQEWW